MLLLNISFGSRSGVKNPGVSHHRLGKLQYVWVTPPTPRGSDDFNHLSQLPGFLWPHIHHGRYEAWNEPERQRRLLPAEQLILLCVQGDNKVWNEKFSSERKGPLFTVKCTVFASWSICRPCLSAGIVRPSVCLSAATGQFHVQSFNYCSLCFSTEIIQTPSCTEAQARYSKISLFFQLFLYYWQYSVQSSCSLVEPQTFTLWDFYI